MSRMKTVIPELEEYLATIQPGPTMTPEELLLCLPYSETRQWVKMLVLQFARGGSRLHGPPGLWSQMEPRLSSLAGPDRTSLYFEPDTMIDSIMAGLNRAAT